MKNLIVLGSIFVLIFSGWTSSSALADQEVSFLPTWKLLSSQEKQQFISGYVQAWRDAASVNDVVIGYIKSNPDKAAQSLDSIRSIYDFSGVPVEQLVRGIDDFYADPEHQAAPLSKAVSGAKSR